MVRVESLGMEAHASGQGFLVLGGGLGSHLGGSKSHKVNPIQTQTLYLQMSQAPNLKLDREDCILFKQRNPHLYKC